MKHFRLICLAIAAVGAGRASSDPGGDRGTVTLPPVLRQTEPPDSGQITLPAPPPAEAPIRMVAILAPAAKPSPLPVKLSEDALLRRPVPPPVDEVAVYCQNHIGHWKESDARNVLGEPRRRRPAYDEKRVVNGTIYAFSDPTGKYKELELDFDRTTGNLRTVFVYPPHLTWQDCRRLFSGPVAAADAAQGRKFYSYTKRRLDVLVGPEGKVISLGWY